MVLYGMIILPPPFPKGHDLKKIEYAILEDNFILIIINHCIGVLRKFSNKIITPPPFIVALPYPRRKLDWMNCITWNACILLYLIRNS